MGSSEINSATAVPSTKLMIWLISAAMVSIGCIVLRFSLPISVIITETWSVILCWLKPPYLYIVINFIILTIAASSRFHASQSQPFVGDGQQHNLITVKTPPPSVFASSSSSMPPQQEVRSTAEVRVVELKTDDGEKSEVGFDVSEDELLFNQLVEEEEEKEDHVEDVVDESPASGYSAPPMQENMGRWITAESLLLAREKPLVSSRFGNRRPIRTGIAHGGEVRALGVSRPKKQETLESTWKKITDGRQVPLTRHSKTKSEDGEHVTSHVPKSETFKEEGNSNNNKFNEDMKRAKRFKLRIHKELSPSHVELNRRVEAFINKFNEDMKMQRQESLNRFMEMINRGI